MQSGTPPLQKYVPITQSSTGSLTVDTAVGTLGKHAVVIGQLHRDQTLADAIPTLVAIAGLLHHPGKLAKIYLTITILICLLNHFLDFLESEVFTQLFGNTLNINI